MRIEYTGNTCLRYVRTDYRIALVASDGDGKRKDRLRARLLMGDYFLAQAGVRQS